MGAPLVDGTTPVAAAYYIAFSYGQQKVVVALNLSEDQAGALFEQIMQALPRK